MNKLPNEILDCIFEDLTLFQKQECMLVCRRWSHVIRSTSLLSTVIIKSDNNLNHLIRTLDANPLCRYQIQRLIVLSGTSLTLSKGQLLDYFPKLRFIHVRDSTIQVSNTDNHLRVKMSDMEKNSTAILSSVGDDSSQITGFNSWINQIEVIEQRFPFQFLFSGVFYGLKTLVLTLSILARTFTDFTDYTPNITSLTMINAKISLANLELVQTGLKALQSLTLENAFLMVDRELNDITTECTITVLSISTQCQQDDIIVIWLQYITKNYTFLQDFRFIFPWTVGFEENITINGLAPLIKSLGSQLEHLNIGSSTKMISILQTLDIPDCNIQTLRISMLCRANLQILMSLGGLGRYIHELTIFLDSVSMLDRYVLKKITTLKKLKLGKSPWNCFRQMSIYLNNILDSCSNTLESLEIYDFDIHCDSTNSKSYPLKNLALHSSIFQSVYHFISDSLPDLDYLTIDERYMTGDITIMLEEKCFLYLEISMKYYDYIMITTLSNGISSYYSLADYEWSQFICPESLNTESQSLIKRATLEQTKGSQTIAKFTCKSIKNLVVNKKIAF